MNQEEQKIYQEFTDYFRNAMSEDDRLARFAEKLTKGEATYVDAWDYARRVGGQMSDALLEVAEEILLSEDGYDIVMSALHDGYQEAADYAAGVQTVINQEQGLGIKGIKPDFMKGRASGIAHQASNAEDLETTEYYLGSPAQHFTENVVGDTIKANEEFQFRSGLNPKIKRTAVGGCCEWCQAVAGEYDYPAPDEIYRRHANCDCLVEYYPGNGLKQNAHTKRWTKDADPEAIRKRQISISLFSEENRYRRLRFGKEEVFERHGKNIKAKQLPRYSRNNLFLADGVSVTDTQIRKFDQRVYEAKDKLGLIGKCNAPIVIIGKSSVLASYNPRTDTFFINELYLDDSQIRALQEGFTCSEDPKSSLIHELSHWIDAEDYRKNVGIIEDASKRSMYTIYQREKAFELLTDAGINLQDVEFVEKKISRYAVKKLFKNEYEEVLAEYRTKIVLEGGIIQ